MRHFQVLLERSLLGLPRLLAEDALRTAMEKIAKAVTRGSLKIGSNSVESEYFLNRNYGLDHDEVVALRNAKMWVPDEVGGYQLIVKNPKKAATGPTTGPVPPPVAGAKPGAGPDLSKAVSTKLPTTTKTTTQTQAASPPPLPQAQKELLKRLAAAGGKLLDGMTGSPSAILQGAGVLPSGGSPLDQSLAAMLLRAANDLKIFKRVGSDGKVLDMGRVKALLNAYKH